MSWRGGLIITHAGLAQDNGGGTVYTPDRVNIMWASFKV